MHKAGQFSFILAYPSVELLKLQVGIDQISRTHPSNSNALVQVD